MFVAERRDKEGEGEWGGREEGKVGGHNKSDHFPHCADDVQDLFNVCFRAVFHM